MKKEMVIVKIEKFITYMDVETRIKSLPNGICDNMHSRKQYCVTSIYWSAFMSRMITLPEEYTKNTLSPKNDDLTNSQL